MGNYKDYFVSGKRQSTIPHSNSTGRQGFQDWECYMLIKYGYANSFGHSRPNEYLIELPLYPDEVQESISANWAEQEVMGRSANLATYAGTSLKSVNFSMNLHRDFLTGSYSLTTKNLEEIAADSGQSLDYVMASQAAGRQYDYTEGLFGGRNWYVNVNKMLQMSCYPQYTNYGAIPPTTYFIFGQMILKGFVESYSTTWKKPLLNTFYGNNTVTISMKCYPDNVITANDIYTGNSSTQNTYNTQFPSNIGGANTMWENKSPDRPNLRGESSIGKLTDIMIT